MTGITRFFIFGNIWVSTCATALAWLTLFEINVVDQSLAGIYANWPVLTFVFCSTLIIYNSNMLSGLADLRKLGTESVRHHWFLNNEKLLIALTVVGTVGAAISFLYLQFSVWMLLAPFALIAISYVIPLIGKAGSKTRLREFGLNKIFTIAAVWAVVTVSVPWVNSRGVHILLQPNHWWMAINRGLFIFAITLPFDVRDIVNDRKINVKTIPILIGIKKTIALSVGLLAIYSAIAFCSINNQQILMGHQIAIFLTALLIVRTNDNRTDMFYSFSLEGTMALLAVTVYLTSVFSG